MIGALLGCGLFSKDVYAQLFRSAAAAAAGHASSSCAHQAAPNATTTGLTKKRPACCIAGAGRRQLLRTLQQSTRTGSVLSPTAAKWRAAYTVGSPDPNTRPPPHAPPTFLNPIYAAHAKMARSHAPCSPAFSNLYMHGKISHMHAAPRPAPRH